MMAERRITCVVHIPCRYPDGAEIEPERMNEFLTWFDRQFGGSSPLGVIPGRWLPDDASEAIVEPMLRVEVAVKESEVSLFEDIARVIGRATKQKVIYVVVDYRAEARFLPLEYDDLTEDVEGSGS